ncbi:MAG: uracil-DNA glycosylase [Sphingobacteriales bacterium]|nr:uracil-DNA glycosylase [Sphingobacteriales bacterium]
MIHQSIESEFQKPYFLELKRFLDNETTLGKVIYPHQNLIFNAFEQCLFEEIKVVIIGQDPYHGTGQANGLAFSVNVGQKIPPSLRNIYKELKDDVGFEIPTHGDLTAWAKQGVLLLNSVMTVEEGKPGSHQHKGWETFTDAVINKLSGENNGIVFLLWGNYAKSKMELIDASKHKIFTAAHPSPLSAYQGFFHCKHFSKTNEYLLQQGKKPISWQL